MHGLDWNQSQGGSIKAHPTPWCQTRSPPAGHTIFPKIKAFKKPAGMFILTCSLALKFWPSEVSASWGACSSWVNRKMQEVKSFHLDIWMQKPFGWTVPNYPKCFGQ